MKPSMVDKLNTKVIVTVGFMSLSRKNILIFYLTYNLQSHLWWNTNSASTFTFFSSSSIIMFAATGPAEESQPCTSYSAECSQSCRQFEFSEILLATNNFDDLLVIGRGGFGKVYKGNIIVGSSIVVAAIKRLDSMSSQGAEEFWAEVEMLSRLRHCHLVSLFGYCNYENEMILIYEYMPFGTLEDHLHKLGTVLSWIQRLKICIGAARGLDYLHTGTGIEFGVIHRDVKSSNILLHETWEAKISDFGLSKICPTNQPSTFVYTLVKGTFGYLDPDYCFTGRLTRKSDVYSFGVLLLEVLCRKPAVGRSLYEEHQGLVTWAQDSIKEGHLEDIIDSNIRGQISAKCLKEYVRIAQRCLLSNQKQRPTMAEIVVNLDNILSIQQRTSRSLQSSGTRIFGRVLDLFPFASNGDNSADGDSKLLSKSMGNGRNAAVDTRGAKNKDFKIRIPSLKVFTFADLETATRNFSQDLLLGTGANGDVFLGWVDKNTFAPSTQGVGIAVAVKMYGKGLPELQTLVTVSRQLAHPNIISLLGYCDYEEHKCLLVYEYMHNRNFDHFLFGDAPYVLEPLSWGTRMMIMLGVARGLAYMHSSKDQVIHRDVKLSNILLDEDFNAKLGGLELARFGSEIRETSITTRIVGTSLVSTNMPLSVKSDIYSFGVVLLKTLTGQRIVKLDHQFLADRSKLYKIMDPRLGKNYPLEAAFECAALALKCVAKDRKDRPSSEEVLQSLEQIYVL